MIDNYIVYNGKEKRVASWVIEKFAPILIDCTMLEDIYVLNSRKYIVGLVDETDTELVKEFEKMMEE